jgi:hypothetical protein
VKSGSDTDATTNVSISDRLITRTVQQFHLDPVRKKWLDTAAVGAGIKSLLHAQIEIVFMFPVGNRAMAEMSDERTKGSDVGEEEGEQARAADALKDTRVDAESHWKVGGKDEESALCVAAEIFFAEFEAEQDAPVLFDFTLGESRAARVFAFCCRGEGVSAGC